MTSYGLDFSDQIDFPAVDVAVVDVLRVAETEVIGGQLVTGHQSVVKFH